LIHDVLARTGFTPRGIILPVSAVILANLDEYVGVLETFSRPVREITDYNPDVPTAPASGNDPVCFRFFDATPQAEFLYHALQRTLEEDLPKEIDYLLGFDRACEALNQLMDWPGHSLELFIRVVHQNHGKLSLSKRKSHFDWMSDQEIGDAALDPAVDAAGLARGDLSQSIAKPGKKVRWDDPYLEEAFAKVMTISKRTGIPLMDMPRPEYTPECARRVIESGVRIMLYGVEQFLFYQMREEIVRKVKA